MWPPPGDQPIGGGCLGAAAGSKTFAISRRCRNTSTWRGCRSARRGGTLIPYNFPLDGEYAFDIKLHCVNTRGGDENCADGSSGFPDDHSLMVLIDDEPVHQFTFARTPRRDRYSADYGADGNRDTTSTERLKVSLPSRPARTAWA